MRAAQSCGIAAVDEWRARPDVSALSEQLALWSATPPLSAVAMRDALQPWTRYRTWLDAFHELMIDALRADPLAALPLRMVQGRVMHGLVLLQSGSAEVTLNWIDASMLPLARDSHVLYSASLSVFLVLRASGLQTITHKLSIGGAPQSVANRVQMLADGDVLALDCRREALSMISAQADAVLLRVNVRLPSTAGQQAFSIDDGRPVAVAMGDDSACRMLPLLQVARLAGSPKRARDALMALTRDEDRTLRWAAMRELLVADGKAALDLLHAMADDDPDAGVRRAAASTIKMIHPEEPELCRA
jgi:hypothetical protein